MSLTKSEFHAIVDAVRDGLRESILEEVKGAVHAEAMNILNEETASEFHRRVRAQLSQRVYVEVGIKEKKR